MLNIVGKFFFHFLHKSCSDVNGYFYAIIVESCAHQYHRFHAHSRARVESHHPAVLVGVVLDAAWVDGCRGDHSSLERLSLIECVVELGSCRMGKHQLHMGQGKRGKEERERGRERERETG